MKPPDAAQPSTPRMRKIPGSKDAHSIRAQPIKSLTTPFVFPTQLSPTRGPCQASPSGNWSRILRPTGPGSDLHARSPGAVDRRRPASSLIACERHTTRKSPRPAIRVHCDIDAAVPAASHPPTPPPRPPRHVLRHTSPPPDRLPSNGRHASPLQDFLTQDHRPGHQLRERWLEHHPSRTRPRTRQNTHPAKKARKSTVRMLTPPRLSHIIALSPTNPT